MDVGVASLNIHLHHALLAVITWKVTTQQRSRIFVRDSATQLMRWVALYLMSDLSFILRLK